MTALSIATALLCLAAPIEYTFGDPWGNLPTAQAIVELGTVKLDAYANEQAIAEFGLARERHGHLYYFFPLGTPLLVTPAVWLARRLGMNMTVNADNTRLQLVLSAALVGLVVPLVFAVCRSRLPSHASLLLTTVLVLGTSLTSTLGTALWSSCLTVLFHLLVLLALLHERPSGKPLVGGAGLGLLLFLGYLCRPTAAIFVALVSTYLLIRRTPVGLIVIATLGVLMSALVAFSWLEYGELLPPYYQPSRLGSDTLWTALVGNLFSASRGVLVLSPFLVPVTIGAVFYWRHLVRDPLVLLASVWLLVHWVVVSSYSNWWGGWCFGNRMFADAVPAVIVVTVAVGRSWLASGHRSLASLVLLGALGTASVYIHSVRGLYDRDSFNWCRDGTYVSHLFDWRHPQWLASPKSRARHYRAHLLPTVPLHAIDDPVLPDSSDVLFESWFRHEGGGAWRWSDGIESTILLRLDARRFPPSGRLRVGLSFDTFGPQEVTIAVNGRAAAVTSGAAVGRIETIRFESDLAGLGAIDEDGGLPLEIAFSTPDAKSPASLDPKGRGDRRVLGVSLRRIDLGVEPPT